MALRNRKNEPITSSEDWQDFFIDVMSFPKESSEKYAQYLSDEGFTGEILETCIEDADMKTNIGLKMGEYKKLINFIKSHQHHPLQPCSSTKSPISKIPRPIIKMDSSQLEFDQFSFEWKTYKRHYGLDHVQSATNLFFCCTEELRQHIRTKQSFLNTTDDWKEEDLLKLIKELATSKVSPIFHVQ